MIKMELTGMRYGRILVIGPAESKKGRTYWRWKCDCGTQGIKIGTLIKNTKSCGCFTIDRTKETHTTHGMAHSDEYKIWNSIKQRCSNPKNHQYGHYGGRGISMCDSWFNSFPQFFKDIGQRPSPLHSIDRVNNNGGYEPNNCRWATKQVQSENRRTTRLITHNGCTKILRDWGREFGVIVSSIIYHINKGKPFSWIYAYYKNKK